MNVQKLLTSGPLKESSEEILRDLRRMEETLKSFSTGAGTYREPLERVLATPGKRLRPLLARVSWSMCGAEGEIVPLMTMLETMHTVSLIHDDFVDSATVRRGVETINSREGAEAALRSGDYLLSRAMLLLKTYRGTGINEALSGVSQEMCLGELDQRAGLFHPESLTRGQYDLRITRKTALLMAESCRSGAAASVCAGGKAPGEECEALRSYGLHLGLAFQLRDDLMDFYPMSVTGKEPCRDMKSGVITLPFLAALELSAEKEELTELAKKKEKSKSEEKRLSTLVSSSGAFEAVQAEIVLEAEKAAGALEPLPDCGEKEAFRMLAKAIAEVK